MPRNIDWLRAGLLPRSLGRRLNNRMAYFIFTVIAAIGAELIQDRLFILLASFAITFANRFQIFAPRTFPISRSSFL